MAKVIYNSFGHDFGPSVWAVSLKSCGFWDRDDGWCSINSSRGRVNESVATKFIHNLKKGDRCADVVRVV